MCCNALCLNKKNATCGFSPLAAFLDSLVFGARFMIEVDYLERR